MNTLKTNENGRSMIEMLGVLAIIGVLSVGGIAGYSKAMNKFKTNKVADNVSMIVTNIKTMYAQQKTYGDLTTSSANDMGLIPDELVKKGTNNAVTFKNAFNGDVAIKSSGSTTSTDKKAFIVVFDGLSKEACITLATNDWGSGYSSGLIAIRAQSTPAISNGTPTDLTALIGCPGGAGDGAAAASADASNSINSGISTASVNEVTPMDTSSTSTTGYTACPGGSSLAVPMSVTTAATACACVNGNTCSITWKYY